MLLSVIIPTYNRNDLLSKCLDMLHPDIQTISIDKYEVLISDDSKENVAKIFVKQNYPWVKWVEGSKSGPAANRNNGANKSNGDYIVFIDDDCLPDQNCLKAYEDAINRNPLIKVFEGKTLPLAHKTRFDQECPINENGGYLWSCNFCIEKKFFNNLNGFDESFKNRKHPFY